MKSNSTSRKLVPGIPHTALAPPSRSLQIADPGRLSLCAEHLRLASNSLS